MDNGIVLIIIIAAVISAGVFVYRTTKSAGGCGCGCRSISKCDKKQKDQ